MCYFGIMQTELLFESNNGECLMCHSSESPLRDLFFAIVLAHHRIELVLEPDEPLWVIKGPFLEFSPI